MRDKDLISLEEAYQRYQCRDCGNWFRDGKNLKPKGTQKLVNI